jgi:hypothetical protein
MVAWANLLRKGDLAFLADRLSYFRLHAAQEGKRSDAFVQLDQAWKQLRRLWLECGEQVPAQPTFEARALVC